MPNRGKQFREKMKQIALRQFKNGMPEATKKKLSRIKKKNPTRYWLGKKRSEEDRKKISKTVSMTLMGHQVSEATRRKISQANKGRISFYGSNHPHWRGGISFEPYGKEFNRKLKELIRQRDNYICQECGYPQSKLGYKLPIHHIDYDKNNNKPINLISLCRNCHNQTNFQREDWINYFKKKLCQTKF